MCWVMPPLSVCDDVRLADPVQQRGLAVVDVAQDRDDRRPGHEVLRRRSAGRSDSSKSSSAVRSWTTSSSTPNSMASIVGDSSSRLALMVAIWPRSHQLAEQVVGLDADRLGEAADGDRRLDLGVRSCGWARRPGDGRRLCDFAAAADRGASSSSSLSRAAAGIGRGDAALGGPLVAAGAAAGAVGRRADRAPWPCVVFLLVDRAGGAGGAGAAGAGAGRRAGRRGRPAPAAGQRPVRGPGAAGHARAWPAARPPGRRRRRRAAGRLAAPSWPDRIMASISSRVIRFSGRWRLGLGPAGAAGRAPPDGGCDGRLRRGHGGQRPARPGGGSRRGPSRERLLAGAAGRRRRAAERRGPAAASGGRIPAEDM